MHTSKTNFITFQLKKRKKFKTDLINRIFIFRRFFSSNNEHTFSKYMKLYLEKKVKLFYLLFVTKKKVYIIL